MGRPITVTLQSRNYTLEQSHQILTSVLNRGGHQTCFSGLDINFQSEVEYTADARGEIVGA